MANMIKLGRNTKDLTGMKFNFLTVIVYSHKDKKSRKAYWKCVCDCGSETIVCGAWLFNGDIKSCGCLLLNKVTTHGLSHLPIYKVWISMKQRCLNFKCKAYPNYGGRGIEICDRWLDFKNFYADMGNSPEGKSLDRIDVNGNYEPSNCRWATSTEQGFNKRYSVRSENYIEHNKWKVRFGNQLNSCLQLGYGSEEFFINFIGMSKNNFLRYIDSQRQEGMTWENYGNRKGKWCIDHIIPCCLFDLSKEEDRKKCFHWSNLKPEWFTKNCQKLNEALHG